MRKRKSCQCDLCIKVCPGVWRISAKLKGADLKFFEWFSNNWLNVSNDADYYQAILHGDWPQSVEILERALKTAKEKKLVEAQLRAKK